MKITEEYLKPINGINKQISFYKKAKILYQRDIKMLQSYNTIVAIEMGGKFYKTWNGYSKTTLEHVKAFFNQNITKNQWDSLEIYDLETGEIKPTNKDAQYSVVASSGFAEYRPQARFSKPEEAEKLCERLNHGLWVSWIE